jgi:hypothetical protein
MSNEMSDAEEHIRNHVRKILAQLRALKEQPREGKGREEPQRD